MKCPICDYLMSEPARGFFDLPSVTSDCRQWSSGRSVRKCYGCGVMQRVVKHGMDFDSIYNGYKSYPEPNGRTKKILEFVSDYMKTPLSILDIGSGDGEGIKVIKEFFPLSGVFGYEPHSTNSEILKERPSGSKYDLVTLFHVFEHVENIHEMLSYIKSILEEYGYLLIEVPYTQMWPFDLILADHVWHFNRLSLIRLLNDCGFKIIYLGNDVIKKELTLLARTSTTANPEPLVEQNNSLNWLLRYKSRLDEINEPVAIYGTGPAAAWVGNVMGDKVIYYIDDDSSRIGKFNGKPVQHPEQCEIAVIAPFPDWQLPTIKEKHAELRFL